MGAEVDTTQRRVVSRQQLIGNWDLIAFQDSDHRRVDSLPDLLGLMTCSTDGTFTLQMQRPDAAIVSTWGHFQLLAPRALVHVVEWHNDAEQIGRSRTFDVRRCDPDHLELVGDDGMVLVFER